MSDTIRLSNANDGRHATYYPYLKNFWTGDKAFAGILGTIMETGGEITSKL